jgi:ParB family transcriptional regulator, chromosome partitioning protein
MAVVLDTLNQSLSAPDLPSPASVAPIFHTSHATYRTATYAQLVRSRLNVRRKDSGDTDELAALIASQGLLQNLIGYDQFVHGVPTGLIEVVAGGRRLDAIGKNIAVGQLPEDFPVPVLLVPVEEAVAISLAENLGREPMHHADVFEAMCELATRGISVEDIGLAFGVDALVVRRRLKLAKVAPRFIALYRDDKVTLEQMMALAISDDHAAQERVWDSLEPWSRQPHQLRRLLMAQKINVKSDPLMLFVGLAAFTQAGGLVERDLFSESNEGYTSDAPLLEQLAMAKLTRVSKGLAKEGWAWVEQRTRCSREELAEFARVRTTSRAATEAEEVQLSQLRAELAAVRADLNAPDGECDDDVDAMLWRRDTVEGAIDAIESKLVAPHAGDLALAGAIATVGDDGKLLVHRHLIRASDKSAMEGDVAPAPTEVGNKTRAVHSERLVRTLTEHRTLALHAELMAQPDVALPVLVHSLVRPVFYPRQYSGALTGIGLTQKVFSSEVVAAGAGTAVAERFKELQAGLPTAFSGLFDWLLSQPQSTLLDLLAFCVGCSLDTTTQREEASPDFVALAGALKLDMRAWWTVDEDSYLTHVSKARVVEVVTQAVSAEAAQPLLAMKKDACAAAAARLLAPTGWLPSLLLPSAP